MTESPHDHPPLRPTTCARSLGRSSRLGRLARQALVLLGAGAALQAAAAPPKPAAAVDEPLPGDYRVVDGRVDRGTYTGWRLFHTSCHGCHGIGGVGTDLAPDLTKAIRNHTPRGFATKVLTSYRIVATPDPAGDDRVAERERLVDDILKRERTAKGQVLMPAWEQDSAVPPHVLDLYAYLSARADGAIGPGRPAMMPAPKKRR